MPRKIVTFRIRVDRHKTEFHFFHHLVIFIITRETVNSKLDTFVCFIKNTLGLYKSYSRLTKRHKDLFQIS